MTFRVSSKILAACRRVGEVSLPTHADEACLGLIGKLRKTSGDILEFPRGQAGGIR